MPASPASERKLTYVADVGALTVEEEGDVRGGALADLEQRFPPVRPVLLPEGRVGLVGGGVVGGAPDDFKAEARRAGGPAGDPLRLGVEADAED